MKYFIDENKQIFAYEEGELNSSLIAGKSEITVEEVQAILNPPLSPEEQIKQAQEAFTAAIQAELDKQANIKGYDNIVSACSYASAPNPFQEESIKFVTWRGNVWAYCYSEMDKIMKGEREMPSIEDFINELPKF